MMVQLFLYFTQITILGVLLTNTHVKHTTNFILTIGFVKKYRVCVKKSNELFFFYGNLRVETT